MKIGNLVKPGCGVVIPAWLNRISKRPKRLMISANADFI